MNKIKTIILTLKRSEKEEKIKSKLDNFDFDYEIFYGVDGQNISKDEYNNYLKTRKKWQHVLNTAQLGNTLSHVNIYEKILNENLEEVLILEDDFVFTEHISFFEKYYDQLPFNFDVFFLGLNNIHVNYNRLETNYSQNLFKSPLGTALEGTHALIMKKKFIKNIYEYQKNMLWTDDGSLTEFQKAFGGEYFVAVPQLIKTEKCINLWKT